MPVGVGSIRGAWMSGSIEDSICVVRFLDPLSFSVTIFYYIYVHTLLYGVW